MRTRVGVAGGTHHTTSQRLNARQPGAPAPACHRLASVFPWMATLIADLSSIQWYQFCERSLAAGFKFEAFEAR